MTSIAYSTDGQMIATGGSDGTIKLWDVRNFEHRFTFKGHTTAVQCIKFLSETTLVSGSRTGHVRLWRAATEEQVEKLRLSEQCVNVVLDRGHDYARPGVWTQAANDLWKTVQQYPESPHWHDTAYRLCPLLLYLGRTEEYTELRRRLTHAENRISFTAAHWAVVAYTLDALPHNERW